MRKLTYNSAQAVAFCKAMRHRKRKTQRPSPNFQLIKSKFRLLGNLNSQCTKTKYVQNKKIDLQLINIFFVISSGSLQGNEASKKKDSEAGQIEAVEAMVVMMLQTHNNNFDDSNLTKTVLLTIISQISNFPILLWENKFPRPKKNLVKPQLSLVSPLVLTRIFQHFWTVAPHRTLAVLKSIKTNDQTIITHSIM